MNSAVNTFVGGFLGRDDAPGWARLAFHWCHLAWIVPLAVFIANLALTIGIRT